MCVGGGRGRGGVHTHRGGVAICQAPFQLSDDTTKPTRNAGKQKKRSSIHAMDVSGDGAVMNTADPGHLDASGPPKS